MPHVDRLIADLFEEEDRAREMANRLMQLARTSKAAAAAERERLVTFLRGPMERHMAYEEKALFPRLEQKGLAEEVKVAKKHHDSIRSDCEQLAAATETDAIAQLVFDVARFMMHHTNFECDYIYPELTRSEWRALIQETAHEEHHSR
ncbi:MAG: hemerythrin domain-containing protein [Polyangiaceae bacterium]|nr:hemerythrin domain-containing protein [Polyangiaceae bacterium]